MHFIDKSCAQVHFSGILAVQPWYLGCFFYENTNDYERPPHIRVNQSVLADPPQIPGGHPILDLPNGHRGVRLSLGRVLKSPLLTNLGRSFSIRNKKKFIPTIAYLCGAPVIQRAGILWIQDQNRPYFVPILTASSSDFHPEPGTGKMQNPSGRNHRGPGSTSYLPFSGSTHCSYSQRPGRSWQAGLF